eukprot:gb/GECH01012826.1/.p1 GENE.gb/GECH01012826.1/~~gb/GECH01012826.1/.p1  ORF type:complete len:510 (+),score=125.33 gb/GECH01012826.1/:1-1530(+)
MERVPCSQVQLFISCKNLAKKDVLSASDPMCHLCLYDNIQGQWQSLGRTERLKDEPNPKFSKSFTVDYFFEETQTLRFELYDIDSSSSELRQQDFIGAAEVVLAEIVMNSGNFKTQLRQNRNASASQGELEIRCEEVAGSNAGHIHFELGATKLPKMDFFGSADPFLVFSRVNEDGSSNKVHETEMVKNTRAPSWKPFMISTTKLCNNDFYRPIRIDCYDWDKNTENDLIGTCETNLDNILENRGPFEFMNGSKKQGYLKVKHTHFTKEKKLTDYLSDGWEISLVVGVDFTGSNGNPQSPQSLHFLGTQMNQYEHAITSVADILQYYDADKLFPAFGFGGKMPNGQVSHCFPLNGGPDPHCQGINGIVESYRAALSNVQLWGPTLFTPIIRETARMAREGASQRKYFILLMITDGVITDMKDTISEIVSASSLPLSIIIVGVGHEDFTKMEELDADDGKLRSGSSVAQRDIVQFVPFSRYINMPPSMLARDTLQELPQQFISYATNAGF